MYVVVGVGLVLCNSIVDRRLVVVGLMLKVGFVMVAMLGRSCVVYGWW